MTDLVKIENRKGRWVRTDSGLPLTDDDLHRAYYLSAILWGHGRFDLMMVEALTLPEDELGLFVQYMQGEIKRSSDVWLRCFAEFKAERPPPTAKDKARERWKGALTIERSEPVAPRAVDLMHRKGPP